MSQVTTKEKKFAPVRMPTKRVQAVQQEEIGGGQIKLQNQEKHAAVTKKGGQAQAKQLPQSDENIEFQGKTNKQSVAQDIMRAGYIQSYVDFFYITNNNVPKVFKGPPNMTINDHLNKHNISSLSKFDQSEENLADLKLKLMNAEESTRYQYPDKTSALDGYYSIAEKFFQEYHDFIVSAYFYKRVIEISKQNNEKQYEGKGKLGLGKCHYKVGLTDQAIEILEGSMKESEDLGIISIVELISSQLIQIYNKVASDYEKGEGDQIGYALTYYEKCREVAQKANEQEAEGQICHKIGLLYLKMNNLQRSIQYQQKFLEIAKQSQSDDSKSREMEAHASLAKCYLKKGDNDEAQKHLEAYHSLARELKQNNAQSDAALYLAKLYHQKGNIAKSLEFYQQHFDCARTENQNTKNRKLVDKARVTFGIAKANATIENYIKIVANSDKNLKALLDWKSKKEK